MAGFVPEWMENVVGDNRVKSNVGQRQFAFNILLSKNQMDWLYHKAWLKLYKQPTAEEQGVPPRYVRGVYCLLWNRREDVVANDSQFAPWDYLEHILNTD